MQKFSKWLLVSFVFICLIAAPVLSAPTIDLDGQQLSFDVLPTIDNGRTLVPLRAIFEAMGATVDWDQDRQTATAMKDGTTVILQIGSTAPTINGEIRELDVPAKIIEGRTLAPLRFVGEAFGGTVDWNQASQLISITSVPAPAPSPETPPAPEDTEIIKVHYIDVGQGDSIYIQLPDNNDILIDGGSEAQAEAVINYLKAQGVDDIELMIATHPHENHIGGLPAVLKAFKVQEVLDCGLQEPFSEAYKKYTAAVIAEGCPWVSASLQKYIFGDSVLKILTGSTNWVTVADNSVICRLETGKTRFLFPGNAGMLPRNALKGNIPSEILKVCGHGGISTVNKTFLDKIKPETAIISVGADNSFAHPSALTLFELEEDGVSVFRTDLNGNIVVTTNGDTYSVNTDKNLPAPAKPKAGKFVANIRITQYHDPTCELAQKIAPESQVWFVTEDEAIRAGFMPCNNCIEIKDQDIFPLYKIPQR